MMQEFWKPVPGFEGKYEISNLGRVRNVQRGNILKVVTSGKSYKYVWLTIDSSQDKQLNIVRTLDKLFDEHIYKDTSIETSDIEIWRDVVGYEGCYRVSNLGRVKSCFRSRRGKNNTVSYVYEKIKQLTTDIDGYLLVSLYNDTASQVVRVHRLVAQAFLPNPDNLPQVNHKDGDKFNNSVTNLEWCTNQDNIDHSWKIGLRESRRRFQVKCVDTGEIYPSINSIISKYTSKSSYYLFKNCVKYQEPFHGHYYEFI